MNIPPNVLESIRTQLWQRTKQGVHFPDQRPLIAHYCSTGTLESILRGEEIWFSNPLLMNDSEELVFGMLKSQERFRGHETLKGALGTGERYREFREHFERIFDEFERKGAFDVYIACFSEHPLNSRDGRLSMWRGYGANGNGACIVFDTSALTEVPTSPLVIGKIEYANLESRIGWIDKVLNVFAEEIAAIDVPNEHLYEAAFILFQRFLSLALYTKHEGFDEEQEWRVVYMKHNDTARLLTDMLDYHVGPRGLEPKLKFKIKPLTGATDESVLIDRLVHSIILGPTAAEEIHRQSVVRMLEKLGRVALTDRVFSSSIPYRSS